MAWCTVLFALGLVSAVAVLSGSLPTPGSAARGRDGGRARCEGRLINLLSAAHLATLSRTISHVRCMFSSQCNLTRGGCTGVFGTGKGVGAARPCLLPVSGKTLLT